MRLTTRRKIERLCFAVDTRAISQHPLCGRCHAPVDPPIPKDIRELVDDVRTALVNEPETRADWLEVDK